MHLHAFMHTGEAVLTRPRTRWAGPSGSRLLVFRGSRWRSMVAVAVAMAGLRYS